ncbi:MAG: metallopeptidase family protein [Peptoniphilus sp.]|nr:metallopeptidase family protein [Peptoniphilus sp.]MDY3119023.1 metallopeptidase family protein [Peptoniphilus sp.]
MEDRFDEMAEILDGAVDELPQAYFRGLNGGVLFSKEEMRDETYPELYIMGHYKSEPVGRSIVLYYGSFMALYGDRPHEELAEELKETLYHELTHHLEALAGENDLVLEDQAFLERYRRENE